MNLGRNFYPYKEETKGIEKNILAFHLDVYNSIKSETKERCNEYNITENEIFAYFMLIGFASYEIQNPLRNPKSRPNEFINQIIIELDSFLHKVPSTNFEILYRQDNYSTIKSFSEGKLVSFNTFLNTSFDNYDNSQNIIWIIKPLKFGTNGHNVFLVYNHGEENQVTFKRGATFFIDKIERRKNRNYIYCNEV